MAEQLWTEPNQKALAFLQGIEPRRQQRIMYEDLVREPKRIMSGLCRFLCIPFEAALLKPYEGHRMTRGSPGRFQSLSDPNFDNHEGIDESLAEAWRYARLPFPLCEMTSGLAGDFGYRLPCFTGDSEAPGARF